MTLIIVFTNIIVITKIDSLSFKSNNSFLKEFFNVLDDLNNVNPKKRKWKKEKNEIYMIQFQNYLMISWELIITNTMSYRW